MSTKRSNSNGMAPGQGLTGDLMRSIMGSHIPTDMTEDGHLPLPARSMQDPDGLMESVGYMGQESLSPSPKVNSITQVLSFRKLALIIVSAMDSDCLHITDWI